MALLPPAAIAAADLIVGWVTVTTGSMAPVIHPGDAVRLEHRRPAVGDIVLAGCEAVLLVHRVLAADGRGLWLGGDATASREGPVVAGTLPVVVAIRRAGTEHPLHEDRLDRVLRRLAPVTGHWPLARRVLAAILRRWPEQT